MTHTLGWLKVPRQQLNIENPHLISCCVRHNHLCGSSQVPIIQLSYHPFGNVVRVVSIMPHLSHVDLSRISYSTLDEVLSLVYCVGLKGLLAIRNFLHLLDVEIHLV